VTAAYSRSHISEIEMNIERERGPRSLRSRFHHWRLLYQYLSSERGIALILKDGGMAALEHQPRVGETTWVAEDGTTYDSRDIAKVVDRTEFGYP
jgi:hypothetical protein